MTDTPDALPADATALEHLRLLLGTTWAGQREATLMRRTGGVRDGAVLGQAPAQVAAGRDTADREAFERDEREIRADEHRVRTEMVAAHWRATGIRPAWGDPDQRERSVSARALTGRRETAQEADNAVIRVHNRDYTLRRGNRRAGWMLGAAVLVAAVGFTAGIVLGNTAGGAPLTAVGAAALLAVGALATRIIRTRAELETLPALLERRLDEQATANGRVVLAMSAHYLNGGDPWRDVDTWPAVRRTTIPLY